MGHLRRFWDFLLLRNKDGVPPVSFGVPYCPTKTATNRRPIFVEGEHNVRERKEAEK